MENCDPWLLYPNAFVDGEFESTTRTKTNSQTLLCDLASESVECTKQVHKVLYKAKQISEEAKQAMLLARKACLKADVVANIAKDVSARCSTVVEAVMINQKLLTEDEVYFSASVEAKEGLQIEEFQQVLDFGSLARQGSNLSPNSFDTDLTLGLGLDSLGLLSRIQQRNSRNVACQSTSCDVEDSTCQTEDDLGLCKKMSSQEMQTFKTTSNLLEKSYPRISPIEDCDIKTKNQRSYNSEEFWQKRENIPQTVQQSSEDFLERLSCCLPTVDEDFQIDTTTSSGASIAGTYFDHDSRYRQLGLGPVNNQADLCNCSHNDITKVPNGTSLAQIQQKRLQTIELIEEQSQAKPHFQTYNGTSSPEIRSRPGSPLVTDDENRRISMQLQPSSSPQLFQPKKTRSSSSTDM